jgi:hypothetical protein
MKRPAPPGRRGTIKKDLDPTIGSDNNGEISPIASSGKFDSPTFDDESKRLETQKAMLREKVVEEEARVAQETAAADERDRQRKAAEDESRRIAQEKAVADEKERQRKVAEDESRRIAQEKSAADEKERQRKSAEDEARRIAQEKAAADEKERQRKAAEDESRRIAQEKSAADEKERQRKAAEDESRRIAQEKAAADEKERQRKAAEDEARRTAEENAAASALFDESEELNEEDVAALGVGNATSILSKFQSSSSSSTSKPDVAAVGGNKRRSFLSQMESFSSDFETQTKLKEENLQQASNKQENLAAKVQEIEESHAKALQPKAIPIIEQTKPSSASTRRSIFDDESTADTLPVPPVKAKELPPVVVPAVSLFGDDNKQSDNQTKKKFNRGLFGDDDGDDTVIPSGASKYEQQLQQSIKEEEERKAREEEAARRKAKEEADRKVREEEAARRKAKEEEERLIREEEERKAREEEAKRRFAKEEADRKAREEEEARKKAKEEAERKLREEQEAARKAKEEEERKIREEEERKRKEEQERIRREEEELRRKQEEERKQKEEEERKVREEQQRIRREEEERKRKEEEALRLKLEQERQLREEEEMKARKEEEARIQAKQEEERRMIAENDRKAKELEEQQAREREEKAFAAKHTLFAEEMITASSTAVPAKPKSVKSSNSLFGDDDEEDVFASSKAKNKSKSSSLFGDSNDNEKTEAAAASPLFVATSKPPVSVVEEQEEVASPLSEELRVPGRIGGGKKEKAAATAAAAASAVSQNDDLKMPERIGPSKSQLEKDKAEKAAALAAASKHNENRIKKTGSGSGRESDEASSPTFIPPKRATRAEMAAAIGNNISPEPIPVRSVDGEQAVASPTATASQQHAMKKSSLFNESEEESSLFSNSPSTASSVPPALSHPSASSSQQQQQVDNDELRVPGRIGKETSAGKSAASIVAAVAVSEENIDSPASVTAKPTPVFKSGGGLFDDDSVANSSGNPTPKSFVGADDELKVPSRIGKDKKEKTSRAHSPNPASLPPITAAASKQLLKKQSDLSPKRNTRPLTEDEENEEEEGTGELNALSNFLTKEERKRMSTQQKAKWCAKQSDLFSRRQDFHGAVTYMFEGVFSWQMYGSAEAIDEYGGTYTEYLMRCQWGTTFDNLQPWIVAHRYREFVKLDNDLKKRFPGMEKNMPKLPKKELFRSMDSNIVAERRSIIEDYMAKIVSSMPTILRSDIIDTFLRITERANSIRHIYNTSSSSDTAGGASSSSSLAATVSPPRLNNLIQADTGMIRDEEDSNRIDRMIANNHNTNNDPLSSEASSPINYGSKPLLSGGSGTNSGQNSKKEDEGISSNDWQAMVRSMTF